MFQPSQDPINNPITDYSKRRVVSELRKNEATAECLREYLEHERPGSAAFLSLASQLSFLESHKLGSKPTPDVQAFEQDIRPVLQDKPATSMPHHETAPANELVAKVYQSLPFYTSWFHFDKIHPIEEENIPEFFVEKPMKTPKIYQKVRNFLIYLYWKNPATTLYATTARRCVALDVSSVLRIHTFLETWGLINLHSKNKPLGGHEPVNLDFIQPTSQKKEPQAPTAAFRETQFETGVIELAVAKLGVLRPKCFQCQYQLQLYWYSRTEGQTGGEEGPAATASRGLHLCPACFGQKNYPVFYNYTDFNRVSLWQLLESLPKESREEQPSLAWQEALLEGLARRPLEKLTFAEVAAAHPGHSETVLLIGILRALEAVQLDQFVQASGASLAKVKSKNEALTKMERMLDSLADRVSSGGVEHHVRSRSREHILKPLVQFNQEIHQAFAKKAEKSAFRFAFLEDFEKILYQEKQNLKRFN